MDPQKPLAAGSTATKCLFLFQLQYLQPDELNTVCKHAAWIWPNR